MLWQTTLEILRSRPENTFLTRDELWERVAKRLPGIREREFLRAVGQVHERFVLVAGWSQRGDVNVWGVALKSKVTKILPGTVLVIGVKFKPTFEDLVKTLP